MQPELVTEEYLCLAQTDCHYDEARLRESGSCLKMGFHIREQEREIAAVMIMRYDPSQDVPEPFNSARYETFEDAHDRILAPQHESCDLTRGLTSG